MQNPKKLGTELNIVNTEEAVTRSVEKYLKFVDFEEMKMKNSKIKMTNCPEDKKK